MNALLSCRAAIRAVALLGCLSPLLALAAGERPEAPPNLEGSIEGTTVTLEWDASIDDEGVEGYNIYRDGDYLTSVSDTRYEGRVEAGRLYTFSVAAFDAVPRRFSPLSEEISLPASLIPDDLTIPPSVPTDLSGSVDGTTVSLSWTASTDDEAVRGYNVYRDNRYLTTVHEPRYEGVIAPGETNAWYVVAFDIRANFSQRSERIFLPDRGPIDTSIRPEPPGGLSGRVEPGADGDTVTLSWDDAVDDRGVAGYNIYINGRYAGTRSGTAYTTTVDAGSSNAYSIVTFDIDGNFSVNSDPLILPEGPGSTDPGVPPSVPLGLSGETETVDGRVRVSLSWEASSGVAEVAGYNVYRDNRYLTTVSGTTHVDTVDAGQAVSYSVVAFDRFQNFSAQSTRLNLLGAANRAPFFSGGFEDRTLAVGEAFELLLRAVDLDGGAPGIQTGRLPEGMRNVDNGNGSRTLLWTPTAADVGTVELRLIAVDQIDFDLRTEERVVLTVTEGGPIDSVPFSIDIAADAIEVREGEADGTSVAVSLVREAGFDGAVTLTVRNEDDADDTEAALSVSTLDAGASDSLLTLIRPIGILPILPTQSRFTLTASDGSRMVSRSINVAVTPVARDDVYLLLGQSNMVGTSEAGAKQAGAGQPDEPVLRIRQLNVTRNDSTAFLTPEDFSDPAMNVVAPAIVTAEDPLHEPLGAVSLSKSGTRIGLGLSFAKRALSGTTRNIVLVPAAWSGSGFCADRGPDAQWNPDPSDDPALGDTSMFERALTRADEALRESGGILRGMLWLQGEADSTGACAPLYEENLRRLIAALRTRISVDARGTDARGAGAPVPFVVGTLSRGRDENRDFSILNAGERIVDDVLKSAATLAPYTDVSLHDDLVPANGFPCGTGGCIHFGAEALREMGVRFHDALLRASENVP